MIKQLIYWSILVGAITLYQYLQPVGGNANTSITVPGAVFCR